VLGPRQCFGSGWFPDAVVECGLTCESELHAIGVALGSAWKC
jgi:hypothetical protein